jgi:transposase, IS30 family
MKKYQQLTLEQRYQIYALQRAGQSEADIARILGRHKSTIGRELKRNRSERGYRPQFAHRRARERIAVKARSRITAQTWAEVKKKLEQQWSPEQISGRRRLEGKQSVSHEWIYQHIYRDKQAGGELYHNLRCSRPNRKRYGRYDRRGTLTDQVSIEKRPAIVNKRSRIGDWELDTLLGKRPQKEAIVSITERKSKLLRIGKVSCRKGKLVKDAVCRKLKGLTVHTLTSDNGREFSEHASIARTLNASFYFCHPYASWERGLNENTNGLLRQYFPKRSAWTNITNRQVSKVESRLNNRPRKSLGYLTPNEVYFKEHLQLTEVALAT